MRKGFTTFLWASSLAACLIHTPTPAVGAEKGLSQGVSDLVFHLTAYDEHSRPLHQGQGIVIGSRDAAIVSISLLEDAVRVEAAMMDGSILPVSEVQAVDEISGLAIISLSAGVPEYLERMTESGAPGVGERVLFSGRTVRSDQVCIESTITSVRAVPAFDDLYYVEASRGVPQPGGAIFDSDGKLVGIVTMRFGKGHSGLLASSRRLAALAGQRVQKTSLSKWLDQRVDRWRDMASASYMRGLADFWQGYPDLTIDLLKDHAGSSPGLQSAVAALLGEAYLAMDLLPEAILAFNRAIDPVLPSAQTYRRLAWVYMESDQYSLAEKMCRTAILTDPGEASGYILLARLRNLQGAFELAVYEAVKALERDPDCSCAYFEKGRAHLGMANYGAAIESLLSATTLDPEYGEAFNSLGYAYLRNGDSLHAVVVLKEAVKLQPEMGAAWDNLGEAYSVSGLPDRAVTALRQAVCLDPLRSHTYCRLARELMKQGRYLDAAGIVRQGFDHCEGSQWLVYFLGKSLLLDGKIDLARDQAELLYGKNRKLAAQLLRIIENRTIS